MATVEHGRSRKFVKLVGVAASTAATLFLSIQQKVNATASLIRSIRCLGRKETPMLVLSRKAKQAIRFPELDILVKVLSVKSGICRIGVSAPSEVSVLRDEIAVDPEGKSVQQFLQGLSMQTRHHIRNGLNAVHVGLAVIEQRLDNDDLEGAKDAAEALKMQVKELVCDPALVGEETDRVRATSSRVSRTNPENRQREHSSRQHAPTGAAVVLIVEDNENERELLAGLLRQRGVEVAISSGGEEAQRWLEQNPAPTIILSDMCMADGDGPTFVRQVRASNKLASTSVYGVSGLTMRESGVLGSEVDGWFAKPINIDSLVTTVAGRSTAT